MKCDFGVSVCSQHNPSQTAESRGRGDHAKETTAPDPFAELRKIDTPTITNVVATYPTNPICLGLYNPWSENWYTDTSIRCMYPELGAVAGYAVTCVYSVPDPNYNRLTFMDVIDALDASPKPTILVLQQKFPPELAAKAGLAGEIMITSMQAVGCVGLISNGPSRDIDAIRALKFQYRAQRRFRRPRGHGGAGSECSGHDRRYGCASG